MMMAIELCAALSSFGFVEVVPRRPWWLRSDDEGPPLNDEEEVQPKNQELARGRRRRGRPRRVPRRRGA